MKSAQLVKANTLNCGEYDSCEFKNKRIQTVEKDQNWLSRMWNHGQRPSINGTQRREVVINIPLLKKPHRLQMLSSNFCRSGIKK